MQDCIFDLVPQAGESLPAAERELDRVAQLTRQTLGFYCENTRPNCGGSNKVVTEVLELYKRNSKCAWGRMARPCGKQQLSSQPRTGARRSASKSSHRSRATPACMPLPGSVAGRSSASERPLINGVEEAIFAVRVHDTVDITTGALTHHSKLFGWLRRLRRSLNCLGCACSSTHWCS